MPRVTAIAAEAGAASERGGLTLRPPQHLGGQKSGVFAQPARQPVSPGVGARDSQSQVHPEARSLRKADSSAQASEPQSPPRAGEPVRLISAVEDGSEDAG